MWMCMIEGRITLITTAHDSYAGMVSSGPPMWITITAERKGCTFPFQCYCSINAWLEGNFEC